MQSIVFVEGSGQRPTSVYSGSQKFEGYYGFFKIVPHAAIELAKGFNRRRDLLTPKNLQKLFGANIVVAFDRNRGELSVFDTAWQSVPVLEIRKTLRSHPATKITLGEMGRLLRTK